ncbi:MAG: cupin domain-containing protein [Erysipelotrichaceae bacterium]|nr:cupin domain-containing protein [Erysipelotrichaceae bacterium]
MKYANFKDFKKVNTFKTGIPNFFLARYMTGKTYLRPVKLVGRSMMLANVTFSPGSRCFWHVHKSTKGGGQILICTAGEGWYQEEGKDALPLGPGDVVHIPPGVKHWHGTKKNSCFSLLAIDAIGEDRSVQWLEEVSESSYQAL